MSSAKPTATGILSLGQGQMAQEQAFSSTGIKGRRHTSEHGVALLVRLDVLLNQVRLILLLRKALKG